MTELYDNGWQDMETAPRDGTQILAAYNNDVFWEYFVVWYSRGFLDKEEYPWFADNNAYPEDKFSAWKPISNGPYEIE